MNQKTDGYNKHSEGGHGTQISNWFEEEILRSRTGEGRTVAGQHQPKTREELFEKPPNELNFSHDGRRNTMARTMPDNRPDRLQSFNNQYGHFDRRVENVPTTSVRGRNIERNFLHQAEKDYEQHKKQFEPVPYQYQTTNQVEHGEKGFGTEPIGKRVIKDQDGKPIPLSERDFELMTDATFIQRPQRNTDDQLSKLIDTNAHYTKDIPYSYWQEKLNSGAFYNSKPNPNSNTAFARNNEFLKAEFKDYTHTLG